VTTTTSEDHPYLAIFDHDGVLVDSLELHQKGWRELGKRENLPLTDEFIHATFGMTNPDIFKRLFGADQSHDAVLRTCSTRTELAMPVFTGAS